MYDVGSSIFPTRKLGLASENERNCFFRQLSDTEIFAKHHSKISTILRTLSESLCSNKDSK